jgi:hypothetical protein
VFSRNVDKQACWIASLSLSAAIAVAAVFAVAAPVQTAAPVLTEDAVVNLVSTASGKCLQPINQSHNQGDAIILIDFTLPDPSLEMGWEGEMRLQWTLPPAVRTALTTRTAARRAAASARSAEAEEEEKEKPESRIAELFARLPAQQQAAMRARFTAPSAAARPAVARPSPPMRPVLTVAKLRGGMCADS